MPVTRDVEQQTARIGGQVRPGAHTGREDVRLEHRSCQPCPRAPARRDCPCGCQDEAVEDAPGTCAKEEAFLGAVTRQGRHSRLGSDQSCLVRDDDQLRAVARTQLRRRVTDMGAGGCRTEE